MPVQCLGGLSICNTFALSASFTAACAVMPASLLVTCAGLQVLKLDNEMKGLAEQLKGEESLLVFARGYNYATALEAALKVCPQAAALCQQALHMFVDPHPAFASVHAWFASNMLRPSLQGLASL